MNKYEYQVGGSLKMGVPIYVERQADFKSTHCTEDGRKLSVVITVSHLEFNG